MLDEADRMFEMGFEYQMRSIVNNIRPDRQTLLFSATMKKKIEGFAREILKDPVRIVIGAIGSSNKDIHQVVDVISSASGKWSWLTRRIDDWVAEGKVLIFVGSRVDTDTLAENLKKFFLHRQLAVGLDSLHGDKTQADRSNILRKFRSGEVSVLIATDVASRGLDIKDIRTVVNYDCAKNIDTHVHRIGRTGRMGVDGVTPGTAYTVLVSEKIPSADSSLAVDLVKNLREAEQENQISADLLKLAQSDPRSFALNSRSSGGSNSRSSGDRAGIGSSGAALAMTSAMMAAASTGKQPAAGNASSSKYYVANNKCIVGQSMDRRKNSSESSWTADGRNDLVEGPEQKELKLNTASNAQKNGGLPPSFSTPALAGFVRATSTLASVHANMSSPVEATNTVKSHVDLVRTKKRSRWDS